MYVSQRVHTHSLTHMNVWHAHAGDALRVYKI